MREKYSQNALSPLSGLDERFVQAKARQRNKTSSPPADRGRPSLYIPKTKLEVKPDRTDINGTGKLIVAPLLTGSAD